MQILSVFVVGILLCLISYAFFHSVGFTAYFTITGSFLMMFNIWDDEIPYKYECLKYINENTN